MIQISKAIDYCKTDTAEIVSVNDVECASAPAS